MRKKRTEEPVRFSLNKPAGGAISMLLLLLSLKCAPQQKEGTRLPGSRALVSWLLFCVQIIYILITCLTARTGKLWEPSESWDFSSAFQMQFQCSLTVPSYLHTVKCRDSQVTFYFISISITKDNWGDPYTGQAIG